MLLDSSDCAYGALRTAKIGEQSRLLVVFAWCSMYRSSCAMGRFSART